MSAEIHLWEEAQRAAAARRRALLPSPNIGEGPVSYVRRARTIIANFRAINVSWSALAEDLHALGLHGRGGKRVPGDNLRAYYSYVAVPRRAGSGREDARRDFAPTPAATSASIASQQPQTSETRPTAPDPSQLDLDLTSLLASMTPEDRAIRARYTNPK